MVTWLNVNKLKLNPEKRGDAGWEGDLKDIALVFDGVNCPLMI